MKIFHLIIRNVNWVYIMEKEQENYHVLKWENELVEIKMHPYTKVNQVEN